jgi:hypothetical protein
MYNLISSPHGFLREVVKGCKNHVFMTMRKTMNTTIVVRWEVTHFPSYGMVFMSKQVQRALEKEYAKIITCMKVFLSL